MRELETLGTLNDGKKTDYGMGLISGNYRGLPIIEHNGSLFGYRADILRFPDQKFTVISLCNVFGCRSRGQVLQSRRTDRLRPPRLSVNYGLEVTLRSLSSCTRATMTAGLASTTKEVTRALRSIFSIPTTRTRWL